MRDIKIIPNTTNRIRSTNSYFNEIKASILTPEQEVELFSKFKGGDQRAKSKIIESNLRFVISVAKQYAPKDDPDILMDMIQEGNLGLIKAVEEFDISRGFKFISYAVWHIRQRIIAYLGDKSILVRASTSVTQNRSIIRRIYEKLEVVLERVPNQEEVFEEFKLNHNNKIASLSDEQIKSRIREFHFEIGTSFSLDQHVFGESTTTHADLLIDKHALEDISNLFQDNRNISTLLLNKLGEKERVMLEITYGLDGNNPNIERAASTFNICRERVRQINSQSLKKLKKFGERIKSEILFEEKI